MRTRALWLYVCLWGVWHRREEDAKVDENTYFSFSDKEKLAGLSAEVSFCWELWLTYGPLPRQTRRAVQCPSWVVPCLGIDAGRELRRWHEGVLPKHRVVQLLSGMTVTWSKLNCVWVPHHWNTLEERYRGEKDHLFSCLNYRELDFSFVEAVWRFTYKKVSVYLTVCDLPGMLASRRSILLLGEDQGTLSHPWVWV